MSLLVAGCGLLGPDLTPTPLPGQVAVRAGERMLATHSLHFVIEISGQLAYLDDPPTMALKRAEGDVVRPDRVRALVKVYSLGVVSEVGIIGLGEEQYVTNPLNQQWEKLPPNYGWYFDPTLLFDPEYGIKALLQETTWTFGADEEADDPEHYILHGQLPGQRLAPLTSGMVTSGEVSVDIWVGRKDGYVRRITIVELDSDPDEPTNWSIQFSAFDDPVEIKPPPIQ